MGRSESGEDSGDSSLRRSTRKRTLKRDIDSDYDYDYCRSEYPSTSTFPPLQEDFPTIPITSTPKIKKNPKKREPKRIKFPVLQEPIESEASDEMHESMDYSMVSPEGSHQRSIDPVKEKMMLDSLVKLEKRDLRILNSSDIIKVHCENLKRRMESVTHFYLESRSVSPQEAIPAPVVYYDDSLVYEEPDSDELAVQMVVNDLIDEVAFDIE